MSDLRVITFPPSLDSEFSRFLLTHYGVPYREQRHVMPLSLLYTLRHGPSLRFPLVYGDSVRLDTVHKIVDHFEPRVPAERRLVPRDLAAAVRADWRVFHHELNTPTTLWAYHHLLPHRDIMVDPLSRGAPQWEVVAVERGYPLFAGLFRVLLRPTEQRASAALAAIRSVLDRVDARLADGRPFLNGERFSLSDMAFAVAAAPVTWPDEYGGAIPALHDTPRALRSVVGETRARPSGAFALRIYREHRAGTPA
jgi:glutathione S-transferase